MWDDLNVESFRKTKLMIESYHGTIGGMLCSLQIKMNDFEERFKDREASNQQIADYMVAYIKPGMDRIKNIERAARFAEAL